VLIKLTIALVQTLRLTAVEKVNKGSFGCNLVYTAPIKGIPHRYLTTSLTANLFISILDTKGKYCEKSDKFVKCDNFEKLEVVIFEKECILPYAIITC
jgi:hypothetical protein